MQTIVLASGSPRRKQLLDMACIPHEVIVADTDEHFDPALSPEEAAIWVAGGKGKAVAQKVGSDRLVLAADTMVVLGAEIIGKPTHKDDALRILQKLNGQAHRVVTGVWMGMGERVETFAVTTSVHFHTLTTDELRWYIDEYKPYDKAGAYAVQEWIGAVGIARIDGDFYNVMGLPVSTVVQRLKGMLD